MEDGAVWATFGDVDGTRAHNNMVAVPIEIQRSPLGLMVTRVRCPNGPLGKNELIVCGCVPMVTQMVAVRTPGKFCNAEQGMVMVHGIGSAGCFSRREIKKARPGHHGRGTPTA